MPAYEGAANYDCPVHLPCGVANYYWLYKWFKRQPFIERTKRHYHRSTARASNQCESFSYCIYVELIMGRGSYARADAYTSAASTTRTRSTTRGGTTTGTTKGRTTTRGSTTGGTEESGDSGGISAYGADPSGGCETVLSTHAGKRGKRGFAASASNKSKVNVLATILAVIFTQFIFCVIFAALVILHHARMIDWFPALLEFTGEGYLREVKEGELDIDFDSLE